MENIESYKVKATYKNKEDIIWDLVVMAVVVVMAAVKGQAGKSGFSLIIVLLSY